MNSKNTTISWSTHTRLVVVTVLIVVIGVFIYSVRPLIGPLIISSLSAYTLHPLVVRLEGRYRMRHAWAVSLVFFLFLLILIATLSSFIPTLVRQAQTLSEEFISVFSQLEQTLAEPVVILGRTVFSAEQLASYLDSAIDSFTPAAADAIHLLEATSIGLVWFVVILVTTFYLLLDWKGLHRWFLRLFPPSEQSDIERLMLEINNTWRAYLQGTLALMFIVGVFFTIVGLAIGLPGAVALGLLTGLLSIIPELGPFIAGVLASLVAFFEGSSYLPLTNFWFAILVIGIYVVVMQLKSLWLRPIIMGRFMHMNTGFVFVAIIGAALISGVMAALIVLPVLATAGQIGYYIRCRLFGQSPWPGEEPVVIAQSARPTSRETGISPEASQLGD